MGKNNKKPIKSKSKFFKWGLTAYLVIMASVLSIYIILNISSFSVNVKKIFSLVMPIVDGLIVAYILSPLVDKIEDKIIYPFMKKRNIEKTEKNKKIVRGISVFSTLFIVILVFFLFIKSVVPQLIESIQNIIIQMPVYLDSLVNISNTIIEKLNLFEEKDIVSIIENYYEDIMEFMQQNVMPMMNEWVRKLSNSVFSFLGAIWDLIIGFFIAIYLLSGKETFRGQLKKLIYSVFSRERANLIVSDIRYIDRTFLSFVGGKIVDSIIIGLLCFICLTIFNIPYTILISVIIGVTNIIPFFGPFLGAIPSAILILLIDPVKALYFIIIVIVLQQIDGNFIGPMILGNSTGLTGFWVIFSITLFGGLFGVAGMFLGVPTFACIYAWIKRRMKYSLKNKDLSIQTHDYIDLDYINKDHKIVDKITPESTTDNKPKQSLKNKVQNNIESSKEYVNKIIHHKTNSEAEKAEDTEIAITNNDSDANETNKD